jgi:hypothetical protein
MVSGKEVGLVKKKFHIRSVLDLEEHVLISDSQEDLDAIYDSYDTTDYEKDYGSS